MRRHRIVLAAALAAACAAVPLPRRSAYHPSDADLSVTRIVHGSIILEMRGTRVVVDPWFESGWVVRQQEPLGLTPDSLPSFAAVLVTHGHRDHFDPGALRRLAATVPEVVARPELHGRLAALGFRTVTDLGWWDHARIGEVDVTAVPARHGVPENGYVLAGGGVTVYVAGDTRYFDELVDVATVFPGLPVEPQRDAASARVTAGTSAMPTTRWPAAVRCGSMVKYVADPASSARRRSAMGSTHTSEFAPHHASIAWTRGSSVRMRAVTSAGWGEE